MPASAVHPIEADHSTAPANGGLPPHQRSPAPNDPGASADLWIGRGHTWLTLDKIRGLALRGTGARDAGWDIATEQDHMAQDSTHIEGTVKALARLRDEHEQKASSLQRIMDRFTQRAASPGFLISFTGILIFWAGVNSALLWLGKTPFDGPPFFWMQGAVSLVALYMTVLILATQRRENELASHHEHLTLELAILSEQKTAKIIALLEELRQDHPDIHDRIDQEAVALSEPTDPQLVLETIKKRGAN
jgi:uncharacterized membrane protein